MTSFDRRERITTTVEFIIPTYGTAVPWRDVDAAISAARQESNTSAEDEAIYVRGDADAITVFYELPRAN
jgi:hypothetical protein